ncbi:glycerol-3-phosphate dehydrogenase/oxidase [Microbacterium sp. CIAB417]|uniref:glycerol-3-phosphate dehydrogenase/oxidase n=1 Tax=Microbacterium sp. CIAB417 TaxID=2860287 RepID=UPI001FAC72A9|nr:glycerol-3-phosphate dehydrogenase/oxidase [Microbacterium sp. CIAB417]
MSLRRALPTGAVDVLVVGGGITGVATAYEAASRGLSVALVEADDLGGATSAATGKLIHGGLRYLKNLEVRLVRESLAERRTLLAIAPHLVRPVGMVLPEPGLIEHLGLTAYDVLSFDRNRLSDAASHIPRHRSLSAAELVDRGLGWMRHGILYYDAMMLSPERLTLAFAEAAASHRATISTYTRATRLLVRSGRVVGAEVHDLVADETAEIAATVTIDATGSFSHDFLAQTPLLREAIGPAPAVRSEGIYLVTRRLGETMVLTVSSGGHFSVAPWRDRSLIGPTETPYTGPVDQWRLTLGAIERFIAEINAGAKLPEPLTLDDVTAAYGGLRPLAESAGTDTYRASRASDLVDHARHGAAGLLSALGGKYTTSRAFAQQIVDGLPAHGLHPAPSTTAKTPLPGGDVDDVTAAQAVLRRDAAGLGFAADTADVLFAHYGSRARSVLALAASGPRLAERATSDGEPLAAVAWAVRDEAPEHLTDVLLRRTGIGRLQDPGERILGLAADIMAEARGWTPERTAAELATARTAVRLPVD